MQSIPPLLKGATAGGGSTDFCNLARTKDWSGFSLSPELTERLTKQFPSGTQAAELSRELIRQGFDIHGDACPGEPSIRQAWITVPAAGVSFEIGAKVFWSVDPEERIVWTAGHVAFTGP